MLSFACALALGALLDREYTFMHFVVHPERPAVTAERANEIQASHMAKLTELSEAGHLVAAGPLENGGRIRGICVFVVPPERVVELTRDDPTVSAGLLQVETFRWRASGKAFGKPVEPMEMAQATLGYYNRGPRWATLLPTERERLEAAHRGFLAEQAQAGMVYLHGTVLDEHHRREIVIVLDSELETSQALLAKSPAVEGGLYSYEAYRWWHGRGLLGGSRPQK